MVSIILSNFGFYFNIAIPIAFALFLTITNKEYILREFLIQSSVTIIYLVATYFLLFSTTTDLMDKEYWNGKVSKLEYYEEWTEEIHYDEEVCTGSGKSRKCRTVSKTKREYHSPEWNLLTSNGENISISSSVYNTASKEFGQTKRNIYRSGQVSIGDGDMFYSIPNKIIPTSVSHSFDNYVTAAKQNVIHVKVPKSEIEELVKNGKLKPYPSKYTGVYGESKINRIVDTVGIKNKHVLLESLDLISARIGSNKQCNPIIYIVSDMDRTFTAALEQYWNKAKKNDVVLILNINKTTMTVMWSDVIAWTNNTDFIVDAQKIFRGDKLDVSLVEKFGNLIVKSYVRKPMAEFSYLKENITLEWYWQFVVFIGNLVLSLIIFRYMLTNTQRKGLKVWRRR